MRQKTESRNRSAASARPGVVAAAAVAAVLAAGAARAQEPPPAVPPPVPPTPPPAAHFDATLYGFVELDALHDTTQSYGPASNNAVLARPGTYAGAHARTQFTANNSQLGLRAVAPDYRRIRASGQAEVDFFGVQPTDATEATTFTTPSLRMRLFYLRLETPVVDVLAGQYHDLFGWGGEGFYPSTLAFLGVAGEIYHRNPQIRISKTFTGRLARVDVAAAAVRPFQRDGEMPDLQAGVRVAVNNWKGAAAQGFGLPDVQPLALGISGVGRRFAVAEFLANPGDARVKYGWGVAANAFIPVIPARSAADRRNSLSVTVEASTGTGIADLYTGLTGGALFPMLPDPGGVLQPPPIYRPNVDSGVVTFDADSNLQTIDWTSLVIGVQYYLPVAGGRMWLSANYSRLTSSNIVDLTPEASRGGIFLQQDYVDGNLFASITPAVQVGLSYQLTQQTFGDLPFPVQQPDGSFLAGAHPTTRNHRGELGARLFF
jgi:hypothetical protein